MVVLGTTGTHGTGSIVEMIIHDQNMNRVLPIFATLVSTTNGDKCFVQIIITLALKLP